MKYIEILRAQGHYIMEGAPGEIAHYALKVLCQGDGNERRTPEEAAQVARSVALATNEHDKLTGLHDELVKQRDALVDACEALLAWNKPCESLFQPDTAKHVPITLPEVIELAEAALARVAGGWG